MSSVSNAWLYPSNGHRQLALLRILRQDAFNLHVWGSQRGAACAFCLASPKKWGLGLNLWELSICQDCRKWSPIDTLVDRPTRSCRSASSRKLGAMARRGTVSKSQCQNCSVPIVPLQPMQNYHNLVGMGWSIRSLGSSPFARCFCHNGVMFSHWNKPIGYHCHHFWDFTSEFPWILELSHPSFALNLDLSIWIHR